MSKEKRTPNRIYHQSKGNAKKRGVEFKLTFEEWMQVWDGKLDKRGRGSNDYCMSRYGDIGPYEIGNVFISTIFENTSSAHTGKIWSEESRDKAREAAFKNRGKTIKTPLGIFYGRREAATAHNVDITTLDRWLKIDKKDGYEYI